MPQVISTMTDSVEYTEFRKSDSGGVPEAIHSVTINGGANRAQRKLLLLNEGPSSKAGISTTITEAELDFLQSHPLFRTHVENGFIQVVKSEKVEAEVVAKDMKKSDAAAQLTIEDLDDKNPEARLKGHKLKSAKE